MRDHVPYDKLSAFDSSLGVATWSSPLTRGTVVALPRVTEDGLKVPAWWVDDEEASQAFLATQGVTLGA